jgi:hypothetical protein
MSQCYAHSFNGNTHGLRFPSDSQVCYDMNELIRKPLIVVIPN